MVMTTQQLAVIDPGLAWLLPIPKDSFTMPKFTFGQLVKVRNGDVIGQIIGMEASRRWQCDGGRDRLWLALHAVGEKL